MNSIGVIVFVIVATILGKWLLLDEDSRDERENRSERDFRADRQSVELKIPADPIHRSKSA